MIRLRSKQFLRLRKEKYEVLDIESILQQAGSHIDQSFNAVLTLISLKNITIAAEHIQKYKLSEVEF